MTIISTPAFSPTILEDLMKVFAVALALSLVAGVAVADNNRNVANNNSNQRQQNTQGNHHHQQMQSHRQDMNGGHQFQHVHPQFQHHRDNQFRNVMGAMALGAGVAYMAQQPVYVAPRVSYAPPVVMNSAPLNYAPNYTMQQPSPNYAPQTYTTSSAMTYPSSQPVYVVTCWLERQAVVTRRGRLLGYRDVRVCQ